MISFDSLLIGKGVSMYRLYGFPTQNNKKALYVLEELGVDYEYKFVNLMKGEQRSEEFLKMNPAGKVPVLNHDDNFLWESGAICRYVANMENSPLYPEAKFKRALVDQWLDFFSNHLGRWMNSIFFQKVIKKQAQLGEPDEAVIKESTEFVFQMAQTAEDWLKNNKYFIGDELTIADLCAYAYLEQADVCEISFKDFPSIASWLEIMKVRDSIVNVNKLINSEQ
jgi:glutathione S-transferase